MVARENDLLILFWVLGALVAFGLLCRALWAPLLSRAWRYLVAWWERDEAEAARGRAERECRRQAEEEMRACLGETQNLAQEQTESATPQPASQTDSPTETAAAEVPLQNAGRR